jgi:hypothetical protein
MARSSQKKLIVGPNSRRVEVAGIELKRLSRFQKKQQRKELRYGIDHRYFWRIGRSH